MKEKRDWENRTSRNWFFIGKCKGEEEELLEMAALRGVDEAHEVNMK